jgi:membrane protein
MTVMHIHGMAGGALLASGLATRALFALLPGLLLVVALIGFLVRNPETQQAILDIIGNAFPPIQELLINSLTIISEGALTFTIVGFVGLVWAASGFLQSLEVSFAILLGIERRRDPILRGVIGLVGVAIILLVVGGLTIVTAIGLTVFEGTVTQVVSSGVARVLTMLGVAVMVGLALALCYKLIPSVSLSWAAIGPPALAAGIGIAILTQLFAFLAPFLAGVASLYGAIAAIFVLIAWLQVTMQLVTLGFTWAGLRTSGPPDPSTLPWPTGTRDHPVPPAIPPAAPPPAAPPPAD